MAGIHSYYPRVRGKLYFNGRKWSDARVFVEAICLPAITAISAHANTKVNACFDELPRFRAHLVTKKCHWMRCCEVKNEMRRYDEGGKISVKGL